VAITVIFENSIKIMKPKNKIRLPHIRIIQISPECW
jgi:hypothetical protein